MFVRRYKRCSTANAGACSRVKQGRQQPGKQQLHSLAEWLVAAYAVYRCVLVTAFNAHDGAGVRHGSQVCRFWRYFFRETVDVPLVTQVHNIIAGRGTETNFPGWTIYQKHPSPGYLPLPDAKHQGPMSSQLTMPLTCKPLNEYRT